MTAGREVDFTEGKWLVRADRKRHQRSVDLIRAEEDDGGSSPPDCIMQSDVSQEVVTLFGSCEDCQDVRGQKRAAVGGN